MFLLSLSRFLVSLQEYDARRITNRCVSTGEVQTSRLFIHFENADVVCSLVAAIKELPCGVKLEAAWIIASRPFIVNEAQFSAGGYSEDTDRIMQAVARVDESAVVGNQDFRAKIAARVMRR